MSRARPMTDALREIMYELAALQPEDLEEVRALCRDHRRGDAAAEDVADRLDALTGCRDPERVAVAYEALTERRP